MKEWSQDWSNTRKVDSNRTNLTPLELTDAIVYDMARHYYTADEIADRFNVTMKTIQEHHGEAFKAGKENAMRKPRMLLNKIFDDFSHSDLNFARSDVPTKVLLDAIKLHAQKYEGLGKEQTVTISEKPSASDIKFVPLTPPEE